MGGRGRLTLVDGVKHSAGRNGLHAGMTLAHSGDTFGYEVETSVPDDVTDLLIVSNAGSGYRIPSGFLRI